MIQIKKISNEDEIHHHELENSSEMYNELIGFLFDNKFQEDEINKIDTPFSELEGEYIFVKKTDMKIHFFVGKEKTQMVIDSKKSQKELSKMLANHFLFPK